MERSAGSDATDAFHAVGSGLGLLDALTSCQRYTETDSGGWIPLPSGQ